MGVKNSFLKELGELDIKIKKLAEKRNDLISKFISNHSHLSVGQIFPSKKGGSYVRAINIIKHFDRYVYTVIYGKINDSGEIIEDSFNGAEIKEIQG